MQHTDGKFEGAAGQSIYYQYWAPECSPRALLLLVHGAGEHSTRYTALAEHCCAAGYACAALDHAGHGLSDGVYGHMTRFEHHINNLETFRAQVAQAFPGVPMILVGHSMGGLIAACYLLQHQASFAGCVLSGAAIKTDLEPGLLQTLTIRLLSRLAPRMGVMQLAASGVSRDPEVVQAYCDDPLVNHGKMSARFVAELFGAMQLIQARAHELTLPLLILHGSADAMTSPAGSRFLYDAVSSADKTLELYPELYHEIFNEPERQQVYADMLQWCDKRLAGENEH